MSALDVLRQIKQARRTQTGVTKIVEWGNAEYINGIGVENLTRKDLKNHLEARDLDTTGTRLELIDRLTTSLAEEQLHKFAYVETIDTEFLIQADLEERGSVYSSGSNTLGELGLGDTAPRKVFHVIPKLRGINVFNVFSGVNMAYAITEEHDLYVWGGGGYGKSGLHSNPFTSVDPAAANLVIADRKPKNSKAKEKEKERLNWLEPQVVIAMAGEETSSVTVGSSHCLAIGRGGDCFVWGDGDAGQLGLGDFKNQVNICINNSFPPTKQVGAGGNHSAILTIDGDVYTWGHSSNGRLGTGKAERLGAPDKEKYFFPFPTHLSTLEKIQQISCGTDHTLAYGASGVWAWGNGSGGKLGMGDNSDRDEPCLIPKLRGRSVMQVAAGFWHSMALVCYPPMLKGGWVYTWGSGYHGQLAQGLKVVCPTPEVVEYFMFVNLLVKSIATGSHHCLAVVKEGELYSWGSNMNGCLGRKIDEKDVQYTPHPGHVPGFGALVEKIGRGFPRSISCGREYSIVVTYPYDGPDYTTASKLVEESKIREQEALLAKQQKELAGDEAGRNSFNRNSTSMSFSIKK